jgi:hypothetical protein
MYDYAANPSLKSTFVLKGVHLGEYLYKSFLQHVLGVLPRLCEAIANRQHFGAETVVQFALRNGVVVQTAGYNQVFCHA